MKYSIIYPTFALCIILSFCSVKNDEQNKTIYNIYNYSINSEDVRFFRSLNAIQPGMDTSYKAALYQLKCTYLFLHISDSLGFPITDSMLQMEALRIAHNTLMPHRLDSIRKYCGDSLRYIRYFVLPNFAPRWLYAQFLWHKDIHRPQRDTAQQLIHEWYHMDNTISIFEKLSGKGLQYLAKKYHYRYERYQLDQIGEIRIVPLQQSTNKNFVSEAIPKIPEKTKWFAEQQMNQQNQLISKQLTEKILHNLRIGELFPQPIELPDCFWILQLIDNYRGIYYFDVVRIPKKDFFQWLHEKGYL